MRSAKNVKRVREALKLIGIGRTKLYEAIGAGELKARKVGKRTIILTTDLHRWLEDLPVLEIIETESNR